MITGWSSAEPVSHRKGGGRPHARVVYDVFKAGWRILDEERRSARAPTSP